MHLNVALMPRTYMLMTYSSKPGIRRLCLATILDSKLYRRSHGMSRIELGTRRQHLLWAAAIVYVRQVVVQFRRQHALGQHLFELPSQAGLARVDSASLFSTETSNWPISSTDNEYVAFCFWAFGGYHFGHGTVFSTLFHCPFPHRKSDKLLSTVSNRTYLSSLERGLKSPRIDKLE